MNPSIFTKHKCDTESLKSLFTAKKPSDDVKKLTDLIRVRIKDGRERALQNYRVYAAIDLAYDAPFHQETPTLIRNILDRNSTAEQIQSAMKSWGLCEGSLFCRTGNVDSKGNPILELNVPVFFEVLVPVVRAYLSVRLSKIFNDRNLDPLFKYQPRHYTEINRIYCEIITDIVDTMASTFGYAINLKQTIFNALMYSVSLEFPYESWFSEKEEGDDGNEFTVREGVRYVTPHITRIFYDLQYPLATFNTDTGNTFAGYWTVVRAGEVLNNKQYWNTESVTYGFDWLSKDAPYRNYFEQVYPCTLELPKCRDASKDTDRENEKERYTTGDYDKGLFVSHAFMKLKPADWGMGDYKHPVWFKFTVASDDTIIYAEPFPYCPVTYAGYDPDQNRSKNASLALEIVPWQDLFGNTLTQILLTIKRNLANIIFYDTNMDVAGQVKEIQRRSQWQYQSINLIGFDSLKMSRAGTDPRTTFHEVKFAYADTNAMVASISMYISIMERMLGISSQEIGSAASHQQGNKEIEAIQAGASNRVTYTASGFDDYIDAKKKQLHKANLAYRDDKVVAEISSDIDNVEIHLKELGFKVQGKTKSGIMVEGSKSVLKNMAIENIAAQSNADRTKDKEAGMAMFQALQGISQNPALLQILDPASLALLYETATKLVGADEDFKLRLNQDGVMANQLKNMIQQIQAEIMKQVEAKVATDVAKPAAEAMGEIEKKDQQQDQQIAQLTQVIQQASQKLEQLIQAAAGAPPMVPPDASMTPPPIQPNDPNPQLAAGPGAGLPS